MKKIFILLLVLALLWILKLSYDVFGLTAQQTELSNSLHRIEQSNANLNDQLVALQRHVSVKDEAVTPKEHDLKTIELMMVETQLVL